MGLNVEETKVAFKIYLVMDFKYSTARGNMSASCCHNNDGIVIEVPITELFTSLDLVT